MGFRLGKRRDFFIKKWFQARIICYYLLILAAGGGVLAITVYRRALATLRYCLFRGHSTECSSWELLRAEVIKTNLAATAILIVSAVAAVAVISWAVARAARVVRENLGRAAAGADPATWTRPPRPHEFRRLQEKLAAGLAGHREHVEELRRSCAELRGQVKAARADLAAGGAGFAPGRQRELHAGFERVKHLYRKCEVD